MNIGNMLGFGPSDSAGASGMNFHAEKTPLQQATNTGQVGNLYGQSQQGLAQQMAFMNALQGQNGIQNQSNVFSQQQGLANQLQGVANGTGPNPALAQLNQTTGQNIANQNALMAGQRGAGANVGLLARQSAMQGGNLQQQAVGQGATLAAQQQLSGMAALQQQQANMANLSGNQIGQQAGAIGQYNQATQNEQQNLLNALAQYNNANVAMQGNVNNANAGIAGVTAQGQVGMQSGLLNGIAGGLGKAHGGMVESYADGGGVPNLGSYNFTPYQPPQSQVTPLSNAGQNLQSSSGNQNANQPAPNQGAAPSGGESVAQTAEKAGESLGSLGGAGIKKMVSGMFGGGGGDSSGGGGLMSMIPIAAMAANKGGPIPGEAYASEGKKVPGQAKIQGDSLKNDTVPAMLSPGEVIIPRSVMNSKDPVRGAAQFVAAVLAKGGMK